MTKHSFSFQRSIISTLICLTLVRSSVTRNSFSELDLSSQTLNPAVTGFKITGNAAPDNLGRTVNKAGDINKDGYDDIIVGANGKNSYQGAVYVIYGREESSFLNLDFGTTILDPHTTGFMITGNAGGNQFGFSASSAGDINGDGYDDIIVGAPGKNAAYVIYGGEKSTMSNLVLSSTTLNPLTTGFMITGNSPGDQFGSSVSAAGDINDDGYDDIIVGAPQKNSAQGAAYLIYGGAKSAMSNIDLTATSLNPSTTGFMITGKAASDIFGSSVSTAGDINGDEYDDIIIGAPWKNSRQGAAYVIYGGDKSIMSNWDFSSSATLNPTSTGFMITGNAASDEFGFPVSTAGDIDNDGYDDIIVGAYRKNNAQGAAYVIYGGDKSAMSNIILSSTALDPISTGFMMIGNSAYDGFGYSVSKAGNINNDGYDDIIVGAHGKNGAQGVTYILYGGDKSTMPNIDLSSTALNPTSTGFTIIGNAAGDQSGYSVSTAGDINNDGYDDIIIGSWAKNGGQGAAYVIFASCSKNCKQCSSESVCTECKTSYLLYQSECFASCPEATTLATSATACEDCSTHCKQCSSSSVCTECKNSYILYQSQCLDFCPDGMYLSSTPGTCEDCLSSCSKCSSASACTECITPLLLYGPQCLVSCPKTMFNSNNVCKDCPSYCYSCTSQDSCQVCYQGYTLSNSLCVLSITEAQEKASQVIASATQGIGSLVCVGSAVFPLSALVSKIVQNTRYLNLSVTSELSEVYKTWRTEMISWDVPNLMSDLDHFEISPPLFARYDLGSPFLVNFWPTLINVFISFGTFTSCILLKKVFEHEKYEGWAYSLVLKLVAGSFNFALVQAYACLDDILFYLVLDAKTNPFNSFFSWASMICAIIFLAFGCLQVFFNFWTVCKYQSIKKQGRKDLIEAFNERNKYWELFYSDFNDDNLWSQSFFAFAIVRSTLSSFMITILYDYPLMQTPYLVMIDVAVISFLYLKNPFNTLRGKLAQYYYEIITLLVHLCTFILSLQDSFENPSETVKIIMSTGILYLNTSLVSGAIGFMFIEIYETIKLKNKAPEHQQHQSIPEDNQETQNLTQTAGLFLPSETDAQKRQNSINQEETKFDLFPENNRKRGFANSNFITMESNLNTESSRELDLDKGYRFNQQKSLRTRPTMTRHRQQSIFPSYAINQRQFSNN